MQNLGLIILMKKIGERRVVAEISEILNQGEKLEIKKIVYYDPGTKGWIFTTKLFNSAKVQDVLRYQSFDEPSFHLFLKGLEKVITNSSN